MKKKIKIIDLLCLKSVGEEVPKKIKYKGIVYEQKNMGDAGEGYVNITNGINNWLCKHIDFEDENDLNGHVEILDDEENKDIPPIPDDELYEISKYNPLDIKPNDEKMDYNFKVLQEKINQVVEEFNEFRKGE